MKVGMMMPTMQSVEINEAILQVAIASNADSIWLPDHILGISHPALWPEYRASEQLADPDSWLDPFCVTAILGRQTSLPIGTCVTDCVRRRPADLARTTLTLHNSNKGGFILGIGSGEAESLLPFGYDFARPVGKLEESLKELRALLDFGRMPHGVGRMGLPLQNSNGRPQIWVAGNGPRALELTGRFGDGWLPGLAGPERFADQWRQVQEAACKSRRDAPIAGLFPLIVLGDSVDHVRALLEAQPLLKLVMLLAPATTWRQYGLDHPAGPTCRGFPDVIPHALDPAHLRQIAPRIPIQMVEELALLGNAADIASRLRPYAEAGLQHVVLCDITGLCQAPADTVRLMGELGRLRSLLAVE